MSHLGREFPPSRPTAPPAGGPLLARFQWQRLKARRVPSRRVEEIMTKDVITVSPKTPIHEAAELMIDHGVSGLPVVDDAGSVVGIVSEGDLILREKPRARAPRGCLFFGAAERLGRG